MKFLDSTGLTQLWSRITALLGGKVDKVEGKGLSTNDFTTAEKTKLEGLSNYDDTALAGRVTTLEGAGYQTAAQVTSSINSAIENINIPAECSCSALTNAEITAIIGE